MLGGLVDIDHKNFHFSNAARRFALDAKMFRCRAAVHVENKDDIVFWSAVLKHFRPNDRFHFIAGSRNEFGHETSGVTQCLKYFDFLSKDFFICIDSDYRYLARNKEINIEHFVLQTYTYSFENHHCYAGGLDDVCSRVTHLPNTVFDFGRFLKEFSHIMYDLFIWHLYFLGADPVRFSKFEFNKYIGLISCKPHLSIFDNAEGALDELRVRVEKKTAYLGRKYAHADLRSVKVRCESLGLVPDTAYLFLRGHNMYDMISCLCKEVCKMLLVREKTNRQSNRETIRDLFRDRSPIDAQLKQNVKYGTYFAICKIEEDIDRFL